MESVDGGITTPRGFRASAVAAGIKRSGLDLMVAECPTEAICVGLFTSNAVKAAPVLVSMDNLRRSGGVVRAVVVNSGNANACNGRSGLDGARMTTRKAAELLGSSPEKILLASTGVIGRPLPLDRIIAGLEKAIPRLSTERVASKEASMAIMTTDRVPKETAMRVSFGQRTVTIGGVAKGVGMIHPQLATMLCLLTTDVAADRPTLFAALKEAADQSFNMVSVDRDTSTNDTLILMASGLSNHSISLDDRDFQRFQEALTEVCVDLAKRMVRDGEGATKTFEVVVVGASSRGDARLCARSIASSNLVKTAVFGCDPNWGRMVAAAGYSGARVDQDRVKIRLEDDEGSSLDWVENGCQISERANEQAKRFLCRDSFRLVFDLGLGSFSARAWGCDLTYDYVKVNSQYTT